MRESFHRCRRPVHAGRACLLVAVAWLLAGCGSLLAPGQPTVWYQLEDRPSASASSGPVGHPAAPARPGGPGASTEAAPTTTPPRLMLSALGAGALYESTGIVYGRSPGQRAYYQYANWAERPSSRLVALLDGRLNDRLRREPPESRDFAWVALDTSGLVGDWLLGLRVREFYHDASGPRERAVVEVDAELLDWQARTLLARHRFRAEAPLAASTVTEAVAGLSVATSSVLDQLADWLDALTPARGAPPPGKPHLIPH